MTEALKLNTLLQDRPWNAPLKNGTITSAVVQLDFDDVEEASKRFKPMVREAAYDCGELAIVTYLQALAYKKPLVLLPFVVSGNFHHGSIAYNIEAGELKPSQLGGKRVGVRSYAQTTGVWVRGVLQNEYSADLDSTTVITFQDGHLAEYTDPPNCVRAEKGKKLLDMLLDREIDAAILGSNMPKDARLRTLIPDAANAAKEWSRKLGGLVPINHMFVVKKELCEKRPDVVREIYRMLVEAQDRFSKEAGRPATFGANVEAIRKPLELVIDYAHQQKVIPRKFSVDELFDDVTRALGR
jgi:4,5-dihydroxyphthalate decarboxylase